MEKTADAPDEIFQPVDHGLGHILKFDGNVQDQGAALFQEVQDYLPEELEAESAKVLRLIDWHIMPIVQNPKRPETSSRVNGELDLRHLHNTVPR
jgi:hypothetical protein